MRPCGPTHREPIAQATGRRSLAWRTAPDGTPEFAARSGGKDEQWAGTSDPKQLVEYAWFGENVEWLTHRVGEKKPNGVGLHDMTGNVWEWTSDWYAADY